MGSRQKVGTPAAVPDWYEAVVVIDPATGLPAAAGGGAGTSDTTEATQLLVKTAVETLAAAPPLTNAQAAALGLATQTTLAAVLAKIIAAPATEAKQDALTTIIGAVTASPTANTVLDRLKALLTGIVLAAGDNNIGNVDVATLPTAFNAGAASATTVRTVAASDDPGVVALVAIQTEAESDAPAAIEEAGATGHFSSAAVDETAGAASVMAAPGKLVWMHVYNPHADTDVYLHLFNATSVALNTTEPVLRIPWKAGQAGWAKVPTAFSTGLRISAHPTWAKSATAPAADLIVNIGYVLD